MRPRYLFLLMLLPIWLFMNCSTVKKVGSELAYKEKFTTPYEFTNCQVTIILFQGDTINGRFTNMWGTFYQLHENKDSNIHVELIYDYLYIHHYKKFEAAEINKYTVRGQEYESVVAVTNINGASPKWESRDIKFMKRLTADTSQMHIYRYLAAYSRNDSNRLLFALLFPPDTIIGHKNFDIQYYIHFTGDDFHRAWFTQDIYLNKEIKTRLIYYFHDYAEMLPLTEKLKSSPDKNDLILSLLGHKYSSRSLLENDLLAILAKYNECYYRDHTQ